MAGDAVPHWRDTVALLKERGITDDQIKAKADEMRASPLGKAIRTEDFLMWVVAQQFGLEVPKVSTLERKSRGDAKAITCKDVTREMGEEYRDSNQEFVVEGWILNPVEYATKDNPPKPRIKVTLLDMSGSCQITSFGFDACEHWRNHELDYPAYVRFEGLQVFAIGEDGVTLTHGKFAKCERIEAPYPMEKALPDAADAYVSDGKIARVSGFITDEDRKTWERCSKCGKGKKKCTGHAGGTTFEPAETHTVAVFDGQSRHTLVLFGDLAPRRKLYGHPVEAVAIYRKKERGPGEFEALTLSVGTEAAFPPLAQALAGGAKTEPSPSLRPTEPSKTVGVHEPGKLFPTLGKAGDVAIWPQTLDLLNKNLRPYRLRPKQDIVTAFWEAKMHERDTRDQLARACAQGLIREAGEQYQWMGGEPVVAEPPGVEEPPAAQPAPTAPAPKTDTPTAAVSPPQSAEEREQRTRQRKILAICKKLDDGKGAPWDDVLKAGQEDGIAERQIEDTLNELFDLGHLYEPVLGRLKPTST